MPAYFRVWGFGLIITMSPVEILAQEYTEFTTITPWKIMKRENGTCFAFAQNYDNDFFVVKADKSLSLSLANARFQIPAGQYPAGLTMGGTKFFPAVSDSVIGRVADGRPQTISIDLSSQQLQNLLIASWVKISLAGRDHMLNLSNAQEMIQSLQTCEKYKSDPLQSAR
jgi:hypothetical protein